MAFREILAEFGVDVDDEALDAADTKIAATKKSLVGLAAGFVAVVTSGALFAFTRDLAANTDQLAKHAKTLGVSTEFLAKWEFAARQVGANTETVTDAIKTMSQIQDQAIAGGKEQARMFAALGVRIRDTNGKARDAEAVFTDVTSALGGMQGGSKRTNLAMRLLGEMAGRTLFPAFEGGAETVASVDRNFKRTFGSNFDAHVKRSQRMVRAMDSMDAAIEGLKVRIGRVLIPVFTVLVDGAQQVADWLGRASDNSRLLEATAVVLGAGLAILGGIMTATFAGPILLVAQVAAAVAAVVLIVEDLIVLFTGGRSAIGYLIDELFGVGTAAKFVSMTKAAFVGLLAVAVSVGKAVATVYRALEEPVGAALRAIGAGIRVFAKATYEAVVVLVQIIGSTIETLLVIAEATAAGMVAAWNAVVAAFNAVSSAVRAVASVIAESVTFAGSVVASVFRAVAGWVQRWLVRPIAAWVKLNVAIMRLLLSVYRRVWAAIFGVVASVLRQVQRVAARVWNAVVRVVERAGSAILDVLRSVADAAMAALAGPAAAIAAAWEATAAVVGRIIGGLGRAMETAGAALAVVWAGIEAGFRRTIGALESLGSGVVGVIKGALDGIASVIDFVVSKVEAAVELIRDAERLLNPAKVDQGAIEQVQTELGRRSRERGSSVRPSQTRGGGRSATVGAVRSGLANAQGSITGNPPFVPAGAGTTSVSVQATNQYGDIVIQGGDPEATANAVRTTLREQNAALMREAADAARRSR